MGRTSSLAEMKIGRRGVIGLGAAGALAGIMPSGAAAAKPIRPVRSEYFWF